VNAARGTYDLTYMSGEKKLKKKIGKNIIFGLVWWNFVALLRLYSKYGTKI